MNRHFTKKGQYYSPPSGGNTINVVFTLLVLLFAVTTIYFVMTKPFQEVDGVVSPRINLTTETGKDAQEVVNKIRLYWVIWPIVIVASLIGWALYSMLKQDPNHPYG